MGFIEAIRSFYSRYTDFSTRSSRSEYWWVQLYYILAIVVLFIVLGIPSFLSTGSELSTGQIMGWFLPIGLFLLVNIIPMLALTVRRFHDQDKSGWMFFLNFIPYVGGIVVFVFMLLKGSYGPNRFGEDPLGNYGDIFE